MKKILLGIYLSISFSAMAVDISVKDYKPKANGVNYDTKAIQTAIDDCHKAGGGRVTVPDGTYLIGAIWLRDNVELHLSKTATLVASTRSSADFGDYPVGVPALVNFDKVKNASLTGFGTINGQGDDPVYKLGDNAEFKGKGRRFNLVRVSYCTNIRIRDISLVNSQTWVLRLLKSDGIQVCGVKINSFANHNNDGIDIDSRNVVISDCIIYSEDDALCFKSDRSKTDFTENVTVTNCILATNCNAIKFGTSGMAGYRNISITNCVIRRAPMFNVKDRRNIKGITKPNSTEMGIALEMVDGGIMENINISNIVMSGVMTPIFLRFADRKGEPQYFKNVVISNIIAESEGYMCSSITGIPGHKIEGITLRDIIMRSMGTGTREFAQYPVPEGIKSYPQNVITFGHTMPAHGLYIRHAANITMENIQLYLDAPDERPAIVMDDVENVWLNNFQGGSPEGDQPFIRLNDARKVVISGFRQNGAIPKKFLTVGEKSSDITLRGNDLKNVAQLTEDPNGVVFIQ